MGCAAHQRKKLEHLCRYITRPAIANERLTLNRAGDVVLPAAHLLEGVPYRQIVALPRQLRHSLA